MKEIPLKAVFKETSLKAVQVLKDLKSDQRCRIGLFLPRVAVGSGETKFSIC